MKFANIFVCEETEGGAKKVNDLIVSGLRNRGLVFAVFQQRIPRITGFISGSRSLLWRQINFVGYCRRTLRTRMGIVISTSSNFLFVLNICLRLGLINAPRKVIYLCHSDPTVMNSFESSRFPWVRIYNRLINLAVRRILLGANIADLVITFSGFLKRRLNSLGIKVPVIVTSLGVDTKKFRPAMRRGTRESLGLAFVGRVDPIKGIDVILRTLHYLAGKKVDLTLALAAPQDQHLRYFYYIKQFAKKYSDNVKVVIGLNQEEIVRLYQESDLTILASRSENYPLVVLESLACGTPCLCTNVGDTKMLLTKISPKLTIPRSPKFIADKILWYSRLGQKQRTLLRQKCRRVAVMLSETEFLNKIYEAIG